VFLKVVVMILLHKNIFNHNMKLEEKDNLQKSELLKNIFLINGCE
jgi:hypothetical protein